MRRHVSVISISNSEVAPSRSVVRLQTCSVAPRFIWDYSDGLEGSSSRRPGKCKCKKSVIGGGQCTVIIDPLSSGQRSILSSGVVGLILSSIREATDKKVGIESITFSQCQPHHHLCRISHLNEIILAEPLNLFSDSQNQDVESSSTSASSDLVS